MSITLEHLSFCYAQGTPHESPALHDISLHIDDGEFVGIMGKTGCGKSTLVQLIDGLLEPTAGRVKIDDDDINAPGYNRNKLRKTVGMVFQYPEQQLFETTVQKDVAFGLKHLGLSEEQTNKQVRAALETMGFDYETVRKLSPLSFSGGEKRKLAIAGVLAPQPKILILDEPVAGLDPAGRDTFLSLTKRLNQSGITILMISHNADALAEYAKRILILENGHLLKDGSVEEIFSDAAFLQKHHLGIGQIRLLTDALRIRGYPIPENTIHYNDLLPYLIAIGKGELK